MAYPSDPRNPADASAAPRRGHLTPEEAERLAAQFRPCWELDDAPIASPTTLSVANFQPAPSDGARPEFRAPTPALNGTHLAAPASGLPNSQQPESSVIIDSSDILPPSTGAAPPARPQMTHTLVLPNPVGDAGPRRVAAAVIPGRTVPFTASPPIATPLEMVELTEADFAKPSRKMGVGLWAGIAAAAAAVVGIAVWLGSGSEEKHATPSQVSAPPVLEKTHTLPAAVTAAPAPPPPVETAAAPPTPPAAPSPPPAAPAPPAVPAAPATIAAAAPATPAPGTPPQAAAPTTPPARLFVPAAPRPPTWVPPAARQAAPPPRPKPAGPTIVRDVPF